MSEIERLRAQAEACYEAGDLEGALGLYEQLVRACPDDADVLSDMGAILFALGWLSESQASFARAIGLDPGHCEARQNLDMVCRALGVSVDIALRETREVARCSAATPCMDMSVVVPVHDQLDPLEKCLDALHAQSLEAERYEVLLVANGVSSEDDARLSEMFSRWQESYGDRLRRLDVDRASIPMARNEGVRQACGRIVLQINSDTILSRTALAEHYAEHSGFGFDPRCVVAGGRKFPDTHLTSLFNFLHEAVPLYTALDRLRPRFLGDHTWFITCNLSAPRLAYESFGMYDTSFPWGSDQELGRRWERDHGVRVYVNPNIISYHLHWLSFDQWRRKCVSSTPIWFRRNMGMSIEDMPEDGRQAARAALESMAIDATAVEREFCRLESVFRGPDRFVSETVLGQPAFGPEELVFRLRPLLKDYRTFLQYTEICRRLDEAEQGESMRCTPTAKQA